MASGYVTADGKDLDSRYLAIGGKAASASTADKANSVAWSAVSGKPGIPSKLVRDGGVITASVGSQKNYSVPKTGIGVIYNDRAYLNGAYIYDMAKVSLSSPSGAVCMVFVQAGDTLKGAISGNTEIKIISMKIS